MTERERTSLAGATTLLATLLVVTLAMPAAAAAVGRDDAPPPATSPNGSNPTPPVATPPAGRDGGGGRRTLDDLLGLEEAADAGAAEAERQRREALQRRLTETEKRDQFLTAIDDMMRSAELLDDDLDTGIATQRLQESILDRLEALLRQPPRRNPNQPSPSDEQEQSSDPREAPAQPQQEQGATAGGEEAASDSTPGDPPPGEASLLEQALESEGAEWGNLPDRVRDMIRQGLRDRPSSLYERLTEAYYRRLAEESSR